MRKTQWLLVATVLLVLAACGGDSDDNKISSGPKGSRFRTQVTFLDSCTMQVTFSHDSQGNFTNLVKGGKVAELPANSCSIPNLENDCQGGWPEVNPNAPGLPGKFVNAETAVFKVDSSGIGLPALIRNGEVYSVNVDFLDLDPRSAIPLLMSKLNSAGLLYWGSAICNGQPSATFTCADP